MFPFDTELLISPVYQRAVRAVFKPSRLRDKNADRDSLKSMGISGSIETEAYNRIRSEQIDETLRKNQKQMQNVIKVLLMGGATSGKLTIIEHIRACHGGYSQEELEAYRIEILWVVVDAMRIVLGYADENGLKLEKEKNVEMVLPKSGDNSKSISKLVSAIKILWTNSTFAHCFEACKDREAMEPAI